MNAEVGKFALSVLMLVGGVVLVALGERDVGIMLLAGLGLGAVGVTGRQVVASRRPDGG